MENYSFSDDANVYLQGNDALEPVDLSSFPAIYYVAGKRSKLLVRDYRNSVITAARKAISGINLDQFGQAFSIKSKIDLSASNGNVEIDIADSDTPDGEASLTLWLGVISNGEMAVHRTHWETLVSVGPDTVAFAAIVE